MDRTTMPRMRGDTTLDHTSPAPTLDHATATKQRRAGPSVLGGRHRAEIGSAATAA